MGDGAWYLRISASVYNEMADYEQLRDAVLAIADGAVKASGGGGGATAGRSQL